MSYFVGDLARLLKLSSEMIRYYEKMEMFKPDRQEGSNYRIYSAKDVLLLITAMQLQCFRFKIKDIREMRQLPEDGYTKQFLADMITFREKLMAELEYKNWLLMRCNELIERNHMSLLNKGSFWFRHRPGQYRYPFLRIDGNGEFECLLPEKTANVLLGERILPFCDLIAEIKEEGELWSLMILKEYGDYLKLPKECMREITPFVCASTIIKAEEFSRKSCEILKDYVNKQNYHPEEPVWGVLCGGMTLEAAGYFMELQLPVEKA